MKFGNIRPHGRLVFNDRGGVWKRIGWTVARCIYGQEYGKEIHVDTDVPIYAIFDNRPNRFQRHESEKSSESVSSEPIVESKCPKCGGSLIGKPAGCPTCHIVVPEAPASSVDAKAIPIVQERKTVEGLSGEGIVVEKGPPEPTAVLKGIGVIFMDDDEKELLKLDNCDTAQITALTSSESIRVKLPGKGVEQMDIQDTFFDMEKNTLFVVLRE